MNVGETTASTPQQRADARFGCNICFEPVSEPIVTQCGHLYCWPCIYRWLEPGMLPDERAAMGAMPASVNERRRECPVCKAPSSVTTLVPIYVREVSSPAKRPPSSSRSSTLATSPEEQEESSSVGMSLDDSDRGNVASPEETVATSNTGLRLRFRSRDSTIPDVASPEEQSTIPARPAANSPVRVSVPTSRTGSTPLRPPPRITPLSPQPASLSHGLAWSLAFRNNDMPATTVPVQDPDAVEFLSRILLLLGAFVTLCLLLF